MPEKDPNTWSVASLVVAIVASLGVGAVRYREEMRYTKRFSVFFWGGAVRDVYLVLRGVPSLLGVP